MLVELVRVLLVVGVLLLLLLVLVMMVGHGGRAEWISWRVLLLAGCLVRAVCGGRLLLCAELLVDLRLVVEVRRR